MRGGIASTAFLDRLSIRTDPARTINEVSFLTNEPQTGMILIAMTLEITAKPDRDTSHGKTVLMIMSLIRSLDYCQPRA